MVYEAFDKAEAKVFQNLAVSDFFLGGKRSYLPRKTV